MFTRKTNSRIFFAGLGEVDHLAYTAGDGLLLQSLTETDIGAARKAFEIRYWGLLRAIKVALPFFAKSGSITISSGIGAVRPLAGWSNPASILGALESLTRALAVELAPIRVNAVSSGVLDTNLWSEMDPESRQALFDQLAQKLLVGRIGQASDAAKAYLYMMEQGYGTGQILTADGGHVLV